MEFYEKLQTLRKARGLTQEQLAEQLFVSRTAVSKWESNRGYPNLESLKALSKLFAVSIDELLSGEELVNACEDDGNRRVKRTQAVAFAGLDMLALLTLFLPLFRLQAAEKIEAVPLLLLVPGGSAPTIVLLVLVVLCGLYGIACMALAALRPEGEPKVRTVLSLVLSALLVLALILTQNPYAAVYALFLLLLKGVLLLQKG